MDWYRENTRGGSRSGSARETAVGLDPAIALGYVDAVAAGLLDSLDRVRAVLVKNVR